MTTLEIDPLAKELGDRFQAAGHELYLVGGAVRDLVTGRLEPGVDSDFATDASPAETLAAAPRLGGGARTSSA